MFWSGALFGDYYFLLVQVLLGGFDIVLVTLYLAQHDSRVQERAIRRSLLHYKNRFALYCIALYCIVYTAIVGQVCTFKLPKTSKLTTVLRKF